MSAPAQGAARALPPAQGAARALSRVIGVYQAWSATRPPRCRFDPSCSHYADEAIRTYGAAKGSWLALRRILRCRPGGGLGYDPVPAPVSELATGPGSPVTGREVHRVL